MNTVWKFDLQATDRQTIQMPSGAKVLSIGAQDPTGSTVQLWAEVDTEEKPEDRHFVIVGTGNHQWAKGIYLGTVITAGGALVWHVYEVGA